MRDRNLAGRPALLLAAASLVASCARPSEPAPAADPPVELAASSTRGSDSAASMIGAAGGTVEGPLGASVQIPAGALAEDVEIKVSVAGKGFTTPQARVDGQVFAFEPHGQAFARPVTITLPRSNALPKTAIYTSEPGSAWVRLDSVASASHTQVRVSHFSFFYNGREVCGLHRQACCADEGQGACAGDSLICAGDRCRSCGLVPERCCEGDICHEGGCLPSWGGWETCVACGEPGQPCCPGGVCNGTCSVTKTSLPDTPTCCAAGDACCIDPTPDCFG